MLRSLLPVNPLPPLTSAVIVICVIFAVASGLGTSIDVLIPFFIAAPGSGMLESVQHGEVWRLVTPIFIHFGVLHIVFNMLWLWDLGGLLERRRGVWYLSLFIIVVGVAANLAQYLITRSPYFGGMSGVVYGLLGYIWMQGKYNPRFGFELHQQVVVMMLIWYVICWTGLVGPIANWAHTAGLIIGVVWGYLERGGGSHRRAVR